MFVSCHAWTLRSDCDLDHFETNNGKTHAVFAPWTLFLVTKCEADVDFSFLRPRPAVARCFFLTPPECDTSEGQASDRSLKACLLICSVWKALHLYLPALWDNGGLPRWLPGCSPKSRLFICLRFFWRPPVVLKVGSRHVLTPGTHACDCVS